ncbi:hypothetical protein P8452_26389 [Trifolium repens]|nr:hypothetical protein P8452_26389 [Trifolium repens]
MIEQNKLDEAFSNHPPPHTDPHHAINISDSASVDSTSPPIQDSKVIVHEEKRLGFFGHGFGWDLFILGFFLLAIPWFVGAAIVISIVLDSVQRKTSTPSISEGVDFS